MNNNQILINFLEGQIPRISIVLATVLIEIYNDFKSHITR